jgi:hypothetical protein
VPELIHCAVENFGQGDATLNLAGWLGRGLIALRIKRSYPTSPGYGGRLQADTPEAERFLNASRIRHVRVL